MSIDLDGLLAQLDLAGAAMRAEQRAAARPRLVAASALLPSAACPCGRALALAGLPCDLCLMEDEREVLAEHAAAEPVAVVRRATAARPARPVRRLRLAMGGR